MWDRAGSWTIDRTWHRNSGTGYVGRLEEWTVDVSRRREGSEGRAAMHRCGFDAPTAFILPARPSLHDCSVH